MGIDIANKLASKIHSYHAKSKSPSGLNAGLPGPAHKDLSNPSSPSESLENHDSKTGDAVDMEKIHSMLCPGCGDKVRRHMIEQAKESPEA
jgi:hypothetical protein